MTDIEKSIAKLNDAIIAYAELKHEVRRLKDLVEKLQAHDDPQPTQCPHCGWHTVGAYDEEGYLPLRRQPE